MYFIFLSYVLKIINNVNLEMQSEQSRMHNLLPRLKFLFNQICRNFLQEKYIDSISIKLINLNENHLTDSELYCGTDVEIYCLTVSDKNLIIQFKNTVRKFYIKFCEQLRHKIDFENEILNVIPKFSPENVLSGESNNIGNLLLTMFPDNEVEQAEVINSEYRALADYELVKKLKKLCISNFWAAISEIKNELNVERVHEVDTFHQNRNISSFVISSLLIFLFIEKYIN